MARHTVSLEDFFNSGDTSVVFASSTGKNGGKRLSVNVNHGESPTGKYGFVYYVVSRGGKEILKSGDLPSAIEFYNELEE